MLTCTLCGSFKTNTRYYFGEYNLSECRNCLIWFVSPQPNTVETKRLNSKKYDSKSIIKQYFNMRDIFRIRAEDCVKEIKRFKKEGKLIDVGCSYGFYLDVFRRNGFNAIGIDLSRKAVSYLKKAKFRGIYGRFENYYFPSNSFDVITLFDVIEHMTNPNQLLIKCHRLLQKKGIVVIQTPNIRSIISKITGSKWTWLLIPQHLFIFSIPSLVILLKRNGFRVLKLRTFDDQHEFIRNLLYLIGIEDSGMTASAYKILIRLKYLIIPVSLVWNFLLLGGEVQIYAQKR